MKGGFLQVVDDRVRVVAEQVQGETMPPIRVTHCSSWSPSCCLAAPAAAQETGTPVFMAPYRAFEKMEIGACSPIRVSAAGRIEGEYGFGFGVYDSR